MILVDDEVANALREGEVNDLPDCQREMAEGIRPVLLALGELPGEEEDGDQSSMARFVEIPNQDSRDGYETMSDFVETVADAHLCNLLEAALRGKGPFRRFKDALFDYPAERERWFAFEGQRRREAIEAWAKGEGVEIDFEKGS